MNLMDTQTTTLEDLYYGPHDDKLATDETPYGAALPVVEDDVYGPVIVIGRADQGPYYWLSNDDGRAMHESNRAVIVGSFAPDEVRDDMIGPRFTRWLTVDDTDENRDILADLYRALADYPLLDECDYNERGWDAWNNDTWPNWLRHDVVRDAVARIEAGGLAVDRETVAAEIMADELVEAAVDLAVTTVDPPCNLFDGEGFDGEKCADSTLLVIGGMFHLFDVMARSARGA